jgi:chaperonin GroEL
MRERNLFFDNEARQKLKKGIDTLADMVKVTLGPKGNNVIIERFNLPPLITKDGVSVAREVYLKDSVENMGAQLLKEVASKTNETAGDGTTTATVLAQALILEGVKNIAAGANQMDLKRGIDKAVAEISTELRVLSRSIENKQDVAHVASISANNDTEIGSLIAEAIDTAGNEGVVIVEDSKGVDTFTDTVEGLQLDRGYKHPIFINKKTTMEVELKNPYILICNDTLSQVQQLAAIMTQVLQNKDSSLLIIADDYSDEVMKLLMLNSAKGVIKCCAITSPGFGDRRVDLLNDLGTAVGGKVCGINFPITNITLQNLGKAEKVLIDKNKTIIIGGKGDSKEIEETVAQIKHLIDSTTIEYDRQKLQERLGKLTGGIVVLRVGAVTETELADKKLRIEDALHATRAALEEGIVPGGGTSLIRVRKVLKDLGRFQFTNGNTQDQQTGIKIVYEALKIPLLSICQNAGVSGERALQEIEDASYNEYGYDALGDRYGNLIELGVIDPTKVVRLALENAASIAGMFLSTKGAIAVADSEKDYIDKLMSRPGEY